LRLFSTPRVQFTILMSMALEHGEAGSNEAAINLGKAIHTARQGRYTVQELANAAGVSAGLVSQLERGIGNPSFKTLQAIATALDLRIGDLVEAASPRDVEPMLVRRDRRARLQVSNGGPVYELLTPNLRGKLEVLETSLPPGFSNREEPFLHDGEELVVVLEGSVDVGVGDTLGTLQVGDAITYDSGLPHWWENKTDRPAKVLGVVTPPSF
jgi:transcriptional regulator with XRE-family HTH domain